MSGLTPEMIDAMVAAGLTQEQMAAILKAHLAADEAKKASKRANNAERQRRFKERKKQEQEVNGNADNALPCVTGVTGSPSDKESPQTPKEINSLSKENPPKGGQKKGSPDDQAALGHVWPADAWDRWYAAYPHKVGKGAAESAFEKIRRSGKVPFDALMVGVERYIRSKPPHVDYCNPATWLNQARWEDAPAAPAAKPAETEAERRRRMQAWI